MTLIGYASKPTSADPYRWRWAVALAVGSGIGLACGLFGLHPMLHAIVGDAQVTIISICRPIPGSVPFIAMAGLSGIVVACSGLLAAGRRMMWFGWPILFLIIFVLGASIGMVVAQRRWDQIWASTTRLSPYIFLPRRWSSGHGTIVSTFTSYRIWNFIPLAPPAYGCAAVLLTLAVIKTLHYLGRSDREVFDS
jgi:hypothetical protein